MRFYTRLLLLFVCCILSGAALQAQPGRDPFGKSRIQYKNFDWKLYNTQNFNLYFYKGGDQTANDRRGPVDDLRLINAAGDGRSE